jgi:hypothetical protein
MACDPVACRGCRVVYGDRDGSRTLKRLSEAVDLGDVLRMMSGAGMPAPPDVSLLPACLVAALAARMLHCCICWPYWLLPLPQPALDVGGRVCLCLPSAA